MSQDYNITYSINLYLYITIIYNLIKVKKIEI